MKTKKKVILLGMLVLLCSLSIGMTAQAKPNRTVINFAFDLHVSGAAERIWETGSGIWQIRNTPHIGSVLSGESDIAGTFFYLGNLILFDDLMDPLTFNSIGGGIFEFTGTYLGEEAGFTGKLHFTIFEFYATGYFNVQGSGAFEN
ncbi:MAG: hypothetical protein ACTSQ4_12335 [Candidatus Heimdallarchaeaceae archaeon]